MCHDTHSEDSDGSSGNLDWTFHTHKVGKHGNNLTLLMLVGAQDPSNVSVTSLTLQEYPTPVANLAVYMTA